MYAFDVYVIYIYTHLYVYTYTIDRHAFMHVYAYMPARAQPAQTCTCTRNNLVFKNFHLREIRGEPPEAIAETQGWFVLLNPRDAVTLLESRTAAARKCA